MKEKNKESSLVKQVLIFFVLASPVWVYGFYEVFYANERRSKSYFQEANFEFKGVVTHRRLISHGAGYICLKLDNTNTKIYDPSDSLNRYYCLIKDGKAILLESGIELFEKGDIYIVSSKKDSCYLFDSENKLKWGTRLSLVDWIDSPKSFDLCK